MYWVVRSPTMKQNQTKSCVAKKGLNVKNVLSLPSDEGFFRPLVGPEMT